MAEMPLARRLATGAGNDLPGFARCGWRGQHFYKVLPATVRAQRRVTAHQQFKGLATALAAEVEDGHGIATRNAGTAPASGAVQERYLLPID